MVLIITATYGCKPTVQFTEQDSMLTNCFDRQDTISFMSNTGKKDEIVFFPVRVDTSEYRNIEQGFYDEYVLSVRYTLLDGSYHQFTTVNKKPKNFYTSFVSSFRECELSFLGLLFDKKQLANFNYNAETITFTGEQAKYTGLNINEGIKSFTFSTQKGIVSYIDMNDVEWIRE